MTSSYFNEEQQESMLYLDSLPPEKKCWCGWCEKGRCTTPSPCAPEFSMADRLKATCQCGGYPGKPGSAMFHHIGCSERHLADKPE